MTKKQTENFIKVYGHYKLSTNFCKKKKRAMPILHSIYTKCQKKKTQTSSNKTKYMEAEKCFSKLHKMKNVASLVSLWKKKYL